MVTYADIAEQAGVAASTVSRALRGDSAVSAETRENVRRIAKELGYPLERLQISKPEALIGISCPEPWFFLQGSYASRIIAGVMKVLARHDQSVLLIPELSSKVLIHPDLSGLILVQAMKDPLPILELKKADIPFVMIANPVDKELEDAKRIAEEQDVEKPVDEEEDDGAGFHWIDINHRQGAQDAVRYLWSLGHKRIAAITGDLNRRSAQERLRGYYDVVDEYGLDRDKRLVVGGWFSAEVGEQAMTELLSLPVGQRPTAVFAFSDTIAVGATRAIRSAGLEIPKDISIVGFDNRLTAHFAVPPLTSVDHPVFELGVQAAELLLRDIEGVADPSEHIMLPARLVIRESCQPLVRQE